MSGVDDSIFRLRAYLLALTPQARRRLRDGLERGLVRGQAFAAEATLAELRRLADDAEGAAAQVFFGPLAPFLIDDDAARHHPGRVARASLPALWAFVRHDLVPDETAAFIATVTEALEANASSQAERLTRDFQDRVAAVMRAVFADDDELARRRLLLRIGTPRAAEEAAALRWSLRGRDMLAALAARLPVTIDDLPHERVAAVRTMIEDAARPREVFVHALLTVMRRLAAPWQIVRLAAQAAGSNAAARIAATPYGIAIDILLVDIERQIGILSAALADGEGAAAVALMRGIDTTVRGLRAEIAIPVGSTLARRLGSLSGEAAALARAAIAA